MANWTTTGYELFNATALPATAEFTIVPDAGYSISAAQFQYSQAISYIVDITFSDNGNAGTPTNTVKGTIQFAGSDDYTFNSDIQQSITLNVIEEDQINSVTFSTAVTVQSYGNNSLVSGAEVNISTNSSYTGYETLLNPSSSWNPEYGNNGTTYAAFPLINIPLDSHVNFMEIIITPDQGHYFTDSPHEDANGNSIFALEDSSLTLNLPGFGNGTQSYQAEEYLSEQVWEISREFIMEPVNGNTQSISESVMVCTGIKFVINYFSPATMLLLDLNNNNTFNEQFVINISVPGVVPRVLHFLDQGPLQFSPDEVSDTQLPIKNTVTSYSIAESGTNTEIFNPDAEAFADFVSLNLAQNTGSTVKSGILTITANAAAVNNSPATTSSSIQIDQSFVVSHSLQVFAKLSSQDDSSYHPLGVPSISPYGGNVTIKVETNIPVNNQFTASEVFLSDNVYPNVNNESNISSSFNGSGINFNSPTIINAGVDTENIDGVLLTSEELQSINSQVQNGANIAQSNDNTAIVEITFPENPTAFERMIVLFFNHPIDADVNDFIIIKQDPGYSSSVNTLQFFAATGYDSNGVPTGFEDLSSNMPTAKTDNNYIQNDGGIIKIYAKVPDENFINSQVSLQDMFVLQNLSQVIPPEFFGGLQPNNYFLSSNQEGYQHFHNLQVNSFAYNSSTMTGGPVNIEITFNAPQNDYYFGNNSNFFNNLATAQSGNVILGTIEPQHAELQILGYNPMNPYFSANNTGNNSPDDIASFKQAKLDTVLVSSSGDEPSGSVTQITDNLHVTYFDSETGQAKVEILQYKDIIVDEDTGQLSLSDWKTTAIDGPPSWCGVDENFTQHSVTSSVSSQAFNLTTFDSFTLHHQASSSTLGRSIKLGYSTASAPVDSENITTFIPPFAKIKTLNFTTPLDYVYLQSFNYTDNANESKLYTFTQEQLYSDVDMVIGATNENGITVSHDISQWSNIGEHNHYWNINMNDFFSIANQYSGLVSGLAGDRSFTLTFRLNQAYESGFKIRRIVVVHDNAVVTEFEDPNSLQVFPDAAAENFIDFIFYNTVTSSIYNETVGQVTFKINANKLHTAKTKPNGDTNKALNQQIFILVSRADFDPDTDLLSPAGEFPWKSEMVRLEFFASGNYSTYTSIDPSSL